MDKKAHTRLPFYDNYTPTNAEILSQAKSQVMGQFLVDGNLEVYWLDPNGKAPPNGYESFVLCDAGCTYHFWFSSGRYEDLVQRWGAHQSLLRFCVDARVNAQLAEARRLQASENPLVYVIQRIADGRWMDIKETCRASEPKWVQNFSDSFVFHDLRAAKTWASREDYSRIVSFGLNRVEAQ